MTDPYKVLGVSFNATDEQVKDAYRQLARKYHPDNYANNPLADLATEKMKEINEAYDEVQNRRKGGQGTGGGYSSSGSGAGNYSQGSSQFADIRRLINNSRIPEAEELLDGVPTSQRDGEWHFLKGMVSYRKGWLDAAVGYFGSACRMEPANQEYRNAYQQLVYQQQSGYGRGGMAGGSSMCETCATLYCCSTLCNCMGAGC